MSEADRQYELAYVISPAVPDEGVNELHERISEIVRQLGGTVDKTDNWGRRRLAYEINRHREGTYVIALITGPGEMVTELERRLRVMEQLLRHLLIRVDEVLRKAEHKRARRQGRHDRRRARKDAKGGSGSPAPVAAAAVEPAAGDGEPVAPAPADAQPDAEVDTQVNAQPVTPADAPADAPADTRTDEEKKS